MQLKCFCSECGGFFDAGPEPSPKLSTSPPSSLGSPGRRPPKSPSEHKERKPSSSDDKKKVCDLFTRSFTGELWWVSSITDAVRSCFFSAPSGLQRLQLLLGGPPQRSHHSEEDRYGFLRDGLQGQVAWRRSGQDTQSDRADARAAAGLQKRNAGPAVSAAKQKKFCSLLEVGMGLVTLPPCSPQENPPRQHPAVHGLHDQAQLRHHHSVVRGQQPLPPSACHRDQV